MSLKISIYHDSSNVKFVYFSNMMYEVVADISMEIDIFADEISRMIGVHFWWKSQKWMLKDPL